jgi:hypothetical protein
LSKQSGDNDCWPCQIKLPSASANILQDEEPDGRRQISLGARGIDLGNDVREREIALGGQFLQRFPKGVLEGYARLVAGNDDRTFNDFAFHDSPSLYIIGFQAVSVEVPFGLLLVRLQPVSIDARESMDRAFPGGFLPGFGPCPSLAYSPQIHDLSHQLTGKELSLK